MSVSQVIKLQKKDQTKIKKNISKPVLTPYQRDISVNKPSDLAGKNLIPIEGTIDPDSYILGPGDILQVAIWGVMENILTLPVLPTGEVMIPTIGSVPVSEKAFTEAKMSINKAAKKFYPQAKISVAIYSVRSFKVHIRGAIKIPGTYEATAVNRVSEVIELAGGPEKWGSPQDILIKRKSGKTLKFNYYQYSISGDLNCNPTLLDGDVIFIPEQDYSNGYVRIDSGDENGGYFKFNNGDTVFDLALQLKIEMNAIDWNNAYIKRTYEDHTETVPIDIRLKNTADKKFTLRSGDIIFFVPIDKYVYVYGAVQNPGGFEYIPGMTAAHYIGIAGGNEKSGSLKRLKITRTGSGTFNAGPNTEVMQGDIIFIPQRFFTQSFGDYLDVLTSIATITISLKAVGIIN